jgi:hypothetical protein
VGTHTHGASITHRAKMLAQNAIAPKKPPQSMCADGDTSQAGLQASPFDDAGASLFRGTPLAHVNESAAASNAVEHCSEPWRCRMQASSERPREEHRGRAKRRRIPRARAGGEQ